MPLVKVSFCAWGSRVDVSPCDAQRRFLAARSQGRARQRARARGKRGVRMRQMLLRGNIGWLWNVYPCGISQPAPRRIAMKRLAIAAAALAATSVFAADPPGFAFHAYLSGFQEVPLFSTGARPPFDAKVSGDPQSINSTRTSS